MSGELLPYRGVRPQIADSAFIAPGAKIIGDVTIGDEASIWFNVVVRGDVAPVRIGAGSNVQDNSLLHVDAGQPCIIGDNVTIGHSAIVHAATVGDGALIGMGAIVLSRAVIGAGAIVAAGSVVPEGAVVEPYTLVMGAPARLRRELGAEERDRGRENSARYVALSRQYLEEMRDNGD